MEKTKICESVVVFNAKTGQQVLVLRPINTSRNTTITEGKRKSDKTRDNGKRNKKTAIMEGLEANVKSQSPKADTVNMSTLQLYEANIGSLTSLNTMPYSGSTFAFLPENKTRKMMSWHSKKMKQLIVLLGFFMVVAMVMTGLFVWRMVYFKPSTTQNVKYRYLHNRTQNTSTSPVPRQRCRWFPDPVPLSKPLPERIQKVLDKMTALLQKLVERNEGIAYQANVVYRDSVIWSSTLGRMKLHPSSPKIGSYSAFPIASITKVVTSLMMYKLYNDGKIKNLDEPIEKFAPSFKVSYPSGSPRITLRHLAGQLSGLKREAPCYPSSLNNICPYNNTLMMYRLRNSSLLFKPGVEPHYSNLAFGVLGNVLASWLNTTYEEWVKENLFKPLQMNSSFFNPTPQQKQNIPTGYSADNKAQLKLDWGWLNPAAGMFSTVADLAELQIMLFNSTSENNYLSPVVIEEVFTPDFFLSDGKSFVGTPWEMHSTNLGYVSRIKNGVIYGYKAFMVLYPEIKLGVNLLCSKDTCPHDPSEELLAAFDEVLVQKNPKRIVPPPDATPYTGDFIVDNIPSVEIVRISEEKGQLSFIVNDQHKFYLTYKGQNSFEILSPEESSCLNTFMIGINHEVLHFDSFSNGTSPGFKFFGIHPNGLARFRRK